MKFILSLLIIFVGGTSIYSQCSVTSWQQLGYTNSDGGTCILPNGQYHSYVGRAFYKVNFSDGYVWSSNDTSPIYGTGNCYTSHINTNIQIRCSPEFYPEYTESSGNTASLKERVVSKLIDFWRTATDYRCADNYDEIVGISHTCRTRGGGCLSESTTSGNKFAIENLSDICSECNPDPWEVQECFNSGGIYNYTYCDCWATPIVIDISGNGFNLTNAQNGVTFDLKGNNQQANWSWTSANSDDAWLALDRNGNGTIDNGTELFGNNTPQGKATGEKRNGFAALAVYDKSAAGGNGNDVIDAGDSIFTSLRLWQDKDHNGISEANELHTLSDLGVAILELKYHESRKTDEHGNQFRYRAKVKDVHGEQVGRWAWDVYLRGAPRY